MNTKSLLGVRGAFLSLGILLVVSLSSLSVFGQGGTSTVLGTVSDPQGKVVAGATVTLIDMNKNTSRTITSEENGSYRFELIPVGDYRLQVEAKGFKKSVISNIHAAVADSNQVDVKLEVGNVSETVTVSVMAGEALVNKEDATLGNVFVNQQITQLPLLGRSVPSLLTLQPGVTRDGSVTGARADQSNITLDGVDINEQQTNSIGAVTDNATSSQLPTGNTVLRLNAEAIQEFRVVTTNPNASQGRSAGAQVEVVTKGGTNDIHGAAFWFHRPTRLSANDFFNNRIGLKRPTLIRNNYGGAVGGPIIKNRAFFFYSYEADRRVTQTGVSRTVPMASLGQGLVRYTNPSGTLTSINAAQMLTIFPQLNGENAAAVSALASAASKYPANDCSLGDRCVNTGGFRFNAATPVQLNSHVARFDVNLNQRQQLFARANVIYDKTVQAPNFPDTPSPGVWSHPTGLAIGHNWTINNTLVNHFVYGFTREAFTQQGDSNANNISFRFVFSPLLFTRDVIRITPVHNIVDDLSWIKGNHTLQMGGNIRLINNQRTSFANAFDSAITNPSFYAGAGTTISNAITAFSPAASGQASIIQNAATALLGRYSQYTSNFTFAQNGTLEAAGTPSVRNLGTEEYDGYVQDSWKMKSNLTMTFGLRYSLSRPVYEKNGFEVKPNIPLSEYFRRRVELAKSGVDYTDALTMQLSGPANNASSLYKWDRNNFQPRFSLAWSPRFQNGFLRKIFANGGDGGTSVVRGGFVVLNDAYGEQIAVSFDLNNSLGFTSNTTIAANTYNTTTRPAPLFTGYSQGVRTLPGITLPGNLTFPQQKPLDFARRIESSFDENLRAPVEYSWNLTFERSLPHGFVLTTAYVGRAARNLLATRDVMALNNLVDPSTGVDWYTAAGRLEQFRAAGTPVASVAAIPYFENVFPGLLAQYRAYYTDIFGAATANSVFAGATNSTQAIYASARNFNNNDWTTIQDDLEFATDRPLFYQEQYGALSAWGSIAKSNYNAGIFQLRQRLGTSLIWDLNYTLSHSLDDASGLQTSGSFGGAFILNPILQSLSYANSDFDFRHVVNANAIWQMPFGRGRRFGGSVSRLADMAIGGWQMTGIVRWNSGGPAGAPFDDARWATNWNVQSNGVRTRPIETSPCRGNGTVSAKLFCDTRNAYQSWRNARPGEAGDRNVLRNVGYFSLDMGLSKSFKFSESINLQLRFEAFNITNTQRMGAFDTSRTGFGLTVNPGSATPPANWTNYTAIQGAPRQMQFGARLVF
jgi:Cna protein B-type domain.